MEIIPTTIAGLVLIKPKVFEDERGYFFESFNAQKFEQLYGQQINFVQDNQSLSQKGVLRGLHFQKPPDAQGKLIRVVKGAVLDIAVDLRRNSPTYGQFETAELSETNKLQMYIPKGFAHGFLTLEDDTVFTYKCTHYYAPSSEGCIAFNDETLNIPWPKMNYLVSEKDKLGESFKDFNSPF